MKYVLIGCGRIAVNHIKAVLNNHLELAAVCDVKPEAMETLLAKHGLEKDTSIRRYTDYREMIEAEQPTLAAIATESGIHAEIALYCIAHGVNVIIEKPMAMSMADADAIVEAAQAHHVKVCACHQNRFNPAVQATRKALEEGRFGKLSHGSIHVRWNRNKGYYDQAPWRGTWAQDGGCMMNQCIHGVDLLPVALIAISNFSSALLVGLMGATILFVASPRVWYFGTAIAGAIPLCGLAVAIPKFRYRLTRIKTWLDPWADPTGDGFQTIQSLYALASGGLFGLGLGQSRQKTFIPEAYNDIIFAIICEELGIIGAALVILLFAVLIWRGIRIAMNAKDSYGMLVATGITAVIAFQSIINIGVVTNTIPNTGQPLPFISYGGTSLLFLMAMVGMLLNISRYPKDREN